MAADPKAQQTQQVKPSLAPKDRGAPTSFENDKYDVSSLTYPDDLMSDNNIYGNNYVIFYINVAEDSKLLNELKYETINDPNAIPPRLRGDAVALNSSLAATVGVTALSGAITGGIAKGLGLSGKAAVAGGAVIGGGSAAAAATQTSSFTRAQKRLKQAIALYMPNDLSVKYSMDWSETDTAVAAAAFAGSELVERFLKESKKSGVGQANTDPAKEAAKVAGTVAALKAPGTGDYMSNITGLAVNPKKEQIFKGVNYRTFSMTYNFYPRNPAETANVNNIIKAFKLHMHPEFKDSFNFLYIYPSEFDIFYYNNGVENPNIHRHTSVILTDVDVNYTPDGQFNSFGDGMSTHISLTLSFKELALLTKQNILDGF